MTCGAPRCTSASTRPGMRQETSVRNVCGMRRLRGPSACRTGGAQVARASSERRPEGRRPGVHRAARSGGLVPLS